VCAACHAGRDRAYGPAPGAPCSASVLRGRGLVGGSGVRPMSAAIWALVARSSQRGGSPALWARGARRRFGSRFFKPPIRGIGRANPAPMIRAAGPGSAWRASLGRGSLSRHWRLPHRPPWPAAERPKGGQARRLRPCGPARRDDAACPPLRCAACGLADPAPARNRPGNRRSASARGVPAVPGRASRQWPPCGPLRGACGPAIVTPHGCGPALGRLSPALLGVGRGAAGFSRQGRENPRPPATRRLPGTTVLPMGVPGPAAWVGCRRCATARLVGRAGQRHEILPLAASLPCCGPCRRLKGQAGSEPGSTRCGGRWPPCCCGLSASSPPTRLRRCCRPWRKLASGV
jgi:hypothetical protein